jgi:putative tryptophan/tyrosine transport system substrate-binding protein
MSAYDSKRTSPASRLITFAVAADWYDALSYAWATMRRRDFIKVIGAGAVTWPAAARAQQSPMPVIGFVSGTWPDAERLRALRQGLKDTGYIEGENLIIAYGWAEGHFERLPEMIAELIRRRIAVIVPVGTPPTLAAAAATKTIPITFVIGEDPVRLGIVASLSRPGGNATGINLVSVELAAKRLELLRELLPQAARIATLVNPADTTTAESTLKDIEPAARAIGLQIQIFNASTPPAIDTAFAAIGRERPDAIFVASDPFFTSRRVQLANLASRHVIPLICSTREITEAGALMSYGSNVPDAWRQLGTHTGRILNGAKPADLPVVQTSKFELVINVQTARILGLKVPPALLARADEVIE